MVEGLYGESVGVDEVVDVAGHCSDSLSHVGGESRMQGRGLELDKQPCAGWSEGVDHLVQGRHPLVAVGRG